MKRKLIIEEWVSLDGHVSDKDGKLDFFTSYVRESYTTAYRADLLHSIDTILFGRKTYQQFSTLWPKRSVENDLLAEKINRLNKIVFSESLNSAPWGQWTEASIESGNPAETIKSLKLQPGKHIVLWASISLAQTLIKEGLVDEYHLHLCPTITGGGRTLFTNEMDSIPLSLMETKPFENGVVLLKYGAKTTNT